MKKLLTFSTTCLLFTLTGFAQQPLKVQKGNTGMYAEWVEFTPGQAPAFTGKQVYLIDEAKKISFSSSVREFSKESDALGYQHYRMQQVVNKIPVENAIYIAHVKNARLLSQNGKWVKNFPASLANTAAISEAGALSNALEFIGAKTYKWQDAEEEAFIRAESNNPAATFFPKASLVYYSGETDVIASEIRLAYKFDIYASNPVSRKIIFVDAVNGTVLGSRDLIHETDAAGTAVTGYSGTQAITTDLNGSSYRLRETGRGNGIQTFNMKKGTSYGRAADFTDADNNWNNVNTSLDQYATDAHWGAEKTYDFYKNNFNRNSIDNNGFAIKSYVHYSRNYFNAFWDGSRMTYGDGNSSDNFKPLTAIDVCGHEITHGLTSFTANLTYSGESGAMNEGFSDIFGTAIEWYARPAKSDWLIGGDFYIIRSMSNPNAYSQPDTYKKTYWYTGTGDNGGVHTNSGVLNFWFYLLSAGGSGTNDNLFAYTVSGLGITKAQAIAYRTLTTYLVSTSNYAGARTASIQAATDLYGAGSNEVTQTINAWNAVGVGGGLSAAGRVITNSTTTLEGRKNGLAGEKSSAVVYPNPAIDRINIQLTDEAGGIKQIQLVDVLGRVALNKTAKLLKGINRVDVQLTGIPAGNYFVKINNKTIAAITKQ